MQTREQQRAQIAFEKISTLQETDAAQAHLRVSKAFPALLHNSGLCQALAFYASKHHWDYLDHLAATMREVSRDTLLDKSRMAPLVSYQHLNREALACAGWLKRYAEALLQQGGQNS